MMMSLLGGEQYSVLGNAEVEQNPQVITERAVAVLGNLSTSPEYFQALRDAGVTLKLALPVAHYWVAALLLLLPH